MSFTGFSERHFECLTPNLKTSRKDQASFASPGSIRLPRVLFAVRPLFVSSLHDKAALILA